MRRHVVPTGGPGGPRGPKRSAAALRTLIRYIQLPRALPKILQAPQSPPQSIPKHHVAASGGISENQAQTHCFSLIIIQTVGKTAQKSLESNDVSRFSTKNNSRFRSVKPMVWDTRIIRWIRRIRRIQVINCSTESPCYMYRGEHDSSYTKLPQSKTIDFMES